MNIPIPICIHCADDADGCDWCRPLAWAPDETGLFTDPAQLIAEIEGEPASSVMLYDDEDEYR